MQKSLFIIHPKDSTTTFLNKIKKHISICFPEDAHFFDIQTNDKSHQECIEAIKVHQSNGLIIFLGHGTSYKLYGSKGSGSVYGNEIIQAESPSLIYDNNNFINFSNIDVFANKKIISLSCNSNGKIGKEALMKGAKVFLGFGDLPTSIDELEDLGEKSESGTSLKSIVKNLKSELNYIIKKSLEIGIRNSLNFNQLCDLIKFITNQRITYFLIDCKTFNERRIIANHLYDIKKGIIIYGDGKEKLIG